jgi:putative sugar O-methyltransferase
MEFINNLLGKVRRHVLSIFISLSLPKTNDSVFKENYETALAMYKNRRDNYSYDKFLMNEWKENTNSIEQYFLNAFSVSFLRNQIIKKTMFAHLPNEAKNKQKKLLSDFFNEDEIKTYLSENAIGRPILNDLEYISSGNTIHHLYHLAKFSKELGLNLKEINSYVELGGGYGNLAKITKKINPNVTFTIIDIPIFSYIQYTYLSAVLGKDQVVFFDDTKSIIPNKVNLIPLDEKLINEFIQTKYYPEVFLSTWALSESNQSTQSLVRDNNYFNAKHILLAYQRANESFKFAQEVTNLNNNYSTRYSEETEYLKDNYYLFASKK